LLLWYGHSWFVPTEEMFAMVLNILLEVVLLPVVTTAFCPFTCCLILGVGVAWERAKMLAKWNNPRPSHTWGPRLHHRIKFQHNRSKCGKVIDDLAILPLVFFRGEDFKIFYSEGCALNCTEFNCGRCRFVSNRGGSKASEVETLDSEITLLDLLSTVWVLTGSGI